MTLFEFEENEIAAKNVLANSEHKRQEARVLINYRLDKIRSDGEAKTNAVLSGNESKAERLRGIKDNRREEREVQRGAEAFNLDSEQRTSSSAREALDPHETDAGCPSREMTLLRKLRSAS